MCVCVCVCVCVFVCGYRHSIMQDYLIKIFVKCIWIGIVTALVILFALLNQY